MTSAQSASATLKAETQSLHEQVERHLRLETRLASIDSYAATLARFLGLYRPLEDRLARVQGLGVDLHDRRKTHLLIADLTALGWPRSRIDEVSDASVLPSIDTPTAAFGVLYVMEGATLGSQYIRRAVQERLCLTAENGCAFFSAYGDRLGERWRDFKSALDRHAACSEDVAEMVAYAQQTFRAFDEWLS